MGIEGEQLVFDYLSRVGDLAHGTSMSAAERAALVVRLRDEIGRKRAEEGGAGSQAEVKRILGKVGSPEDVVAAAAGDEAAAGEGGRGGRTATAASVPSPRAPGRSASQQRTARRGRSRQNERQNEPLPEVPRRPDGPDVPEAPREQAPGEQAPGGPGLLDKPGPRSVPGTYWPDGQIGRFSGGIEIPEMLRPPEDPDESLAPSRPQPGPGGTEQAPGGGGQGAPAEKTPPRGFRRRAADAVRGPRRGGPLELFAVLLLFAGTVMGQLLVLALGWVVAWWSPRLSRREVQWAVFGMPGLVGGGVLVWLFGRVNGYWGEPVENGAAQAALSDNWPWLLRVAALASAAFLLWRARRPKPEKKEE